MEEENKEKVEENKEKVEEKSGNLGDQSEIPHEEKVEETKNSNDCGENVVDGAK